MNYAISRKTDEVFTAAEKYEITNLTDNIVTIDANGKLIHCELNDPDFLFLFGVQEQDVEYYNNFRQDKEKLSQQ